MNGASTKTWGENGCAYVMTVWQYATSKNLHPQKSPTGIAHRASLLTEVKYLLR
jgi:hypothetical protein